LTGLINHTKGEVMDIQYELGLAQFIGFYHGKSQSLIEMVQSMGLAKKEWEKMKRRKEVNFLSQVEKKEIQEYFSDLTPPKEKLWSL